MNYSTLLSGSPAPVSQHKQCLRVVRRITALAFFAVLCFPVYATVYNVTTTTDGTTANTLRGAITAADAAGTTNGPHTINVPAGTYNLTLGEITFGNRAQNITITGAGSATTIINMTTTNQDRIFYINPPGTIANIQTTITGIKFTNGHLKTDTYGGGAIIAGGPNNALTITGCIFQNNIVDAGLTSTAGGAIRFTGGGALTIDQCTFSNNISPATTTNSSASGVGGAIDFEAYSYSIGGVYTYPDNSLSVTNSTFSSNTAGSYQNLSGQGGAINVSAAGFSTVDPPRPTLSVIIRKNTFIGNSVTGTGGRGGAISATNSFSTTNTFLINYNRFYGNTAGSGNGSALVSFDTQGNVDATNNWWGCNSGPASCADKAYRFPGSSPGVLTTTPYLQLRTSAANTTLCSGTGTTITSGFTINSAGVSIPAGNLSTFTGVPISFVATLGTLSNPQTTIQSTGTATVTYTAGNTAGTGTVNALVDNVPASDATARASITINTAPVVTNPTTTTGTAGVPFSQTFTQTGGTAPTTFSINTGTLPTGLTLSSAGVLSGTPTQTGSFPITVKATGGNGCTGVGATYNLVINCQTITVTNPATTTGTQGVAFSQTFTQSGSIGGSTFSINSGTLPSGLTLSAAGVLSGTPTQTGSFPITVKVTDGNGCTGIGATYNLVINCQTIIVTNPATATGTAGSAFSQTFTQTGGTAPTTFSINSGVLPAGLTLSSAGVLSGTPTQTGSFPITVKATGGNGCTGVGATYNLVINCQTITITNPATTTGTKGVAFSQTFTQSGSIGSTTFSINSGVLPTGLALSAAGVLSGTPTQTGSFPITVKVTDGNGCTGIGAAYNLVINCQTITVTNPATTTGTQGVAFSQTFTQSGSIGGQTFSINTGTLPTGLTLSAAGVLSGTPTQTGSFPITVKVTDGNGCMGIGATYNLTISFTCQTITVTNPATTTGTVGSAFSQTFTQTGGTAPTTFSINSGVLPTGLSLSSAGVLSGTPTQTGSFPITVKATSGNECTGIGATYNLVINCQTITVTNPATTTGTQGVAFSQTFTQSGSIGNTTYSLNSGVLPTGLSLSSAGLLSGNPSQSGSFPITVKVTDGNGCTGIGGTYNLTINPGGCVTPDVVAPTITLKPSPTVFLNAANTYTVQLSDVLQSVTDNCDPNPSATVNNLQVTCSNLGSGSGAPHQAYVSNQSIGNANYDGQFGLTFKVNSASGVVIDKLGAFDDQSNGTGITGNQSGGVRVAIFNQTTQTMVTGLDVTIVGTADPLVGNYRIRTLATPVTLPAGNYVIVTKGYVGEKFYNRNQTGPFNPVGDNAGGALSFLNTVYYGTSASFSFPAGSADAGNPNEYIAGTFNYSLSAGNSVTVTATDVSGNTSMATTSVTVVDTFYVLTTKNATVNLNASGQATIVPADVLQSLKNNCGVDVTTSTFQVSPSSFTCADVAGSGTPHQAYVSDKSVGNVNYDGQFGLTFKVNSASGIVIDKLGVFDDQSNGTGITGSQSGGVRVAIFNQNTQAMVTGLDVTIVGTADPLVGNFRVRTLATPITLPAGNYVLVTKGYVGEKFYNRNQTGPLNPVGDNAGGALTFLNTVYYGTSASFSFPAGSGDAGNPNEYIAGTFNYTLVTSKTVTLTATDVYGHQKQATAQVTVKDVTGPTVITKNITLNLNASGNASIVPNDVLQTPVTDNCGVQSVTVNPNSFTCADYSPGGSTPHQAYVSNKSVGNANYDGQFGLTFKVNNANGIVIDKLGAFDDQSNGTGITGNQSGGVRVAIFNQTTQAMVSGLDVTIVGTADPLVGNYRIRTLATPVTLPAGNYVIVTKGYVGEKFYNRNQTGPLNPVGDNAGGALTFLNTVYYGSSATFSFPAGSGDAGNPNEYIAGTFSYALNVSNNKIVTVTATDTYGNVTNATATVTLTNTSNSCTTPPVMTYAAKSQQTDGPVILDNVNMTVKVYPNPSSGQFTVQLLNVKVPKLSLQIMDANGKVVEQKTASLTGKTPSLIIPVDIRKHASGMYLIKVISADGIQSAKVVVSR